MKTPAARKGEDIFRDLASGFDHTITRFLTASKSDENRTTSGLAGRCELAEFIPDVMPLFFVSEYFPVKSFRGCM